MTEGGLAIVLGLFSALTLAVANVTVKRGGDILAGRAVLSSAAAIIVLPFAFIVPLPNTQVWGALALSLPAHLAYQGCLVRAMHRGDLSLVFPVMRGLAPLFVAGAAFLILDQSLSWRSGLGLVVATLAVIAFATPERVSLEAGRANRTALIWAALTAVGVAMYTTMDARGMRLSPDPFTFIVWLFLLDWIGLTAVAAATRGPALISDFRRNARYGVTAGALSVLSFGSALYALRLIDAVMVSALRETAVVIGAFLGWVFLKESFGVRRTILAILLAGGLILMQTG
ncbi:MAG: DMT family transporter [Pseudomonadota bacterium]